jgi:hypothetical protein
MLTKIIDKRAKIFFKEEEKFNAFFGVLFTCLLLGFSSYHLDEKIWFFSSLFIYLSMVLSGLYFNFSLNKKITIKKFFSCFFVNHFNKLIQLYFSDSIVARHSFEEENSTQKRFHCLLYYSNSIRIKNSKYQLQSINGSYSVFNALTQKYQWHSKGILIFESDNPNALNEKSFNIKRKADFF